MILILDTGDLIPEHQNVNVSQVTFDKFNEAAKAAVIAVGLGLFYKPDKQTHQLIYAPK